MLAVKAVTSNRGKQTPGIDNVLWTSHSDKYNAALSLNRRGYTPRPLKRIYIPKRNGDDRPLSIPTMKDRATQNLYKFATEPILIALQVTIGSVNDGIYPNLLNLF